MSSNYECFVTLGDKKHTISINKDINCVNFEDILQHIQKIAPKEDISYETHVFEIFDFNSNSFKRLTSFTQLIKCLARIRVLSSFQPISHLVDSKSRLMNTQLVLNQDLNSKRLKIETNVVHKSDNRFNDNYNSFGHKSGQHSGRQTVIPTNSAFNSSKTQQTYCTTNTDYSQKFKPLMRSEDLDSKTKPINRSNDPLFDLKSEGLVSDGNKTYCQLCLQSFPSLPKGVEHISSIGHMRNRSEANYEDIDKQFLTKICDKFDLNYIINRKKELKKFSTKEKQKLIRHGIRVKDGFGDESYVCLRCELKFEDSMQMNKHFQQFIELKTTNNSDICQKVVIKSKNKRHKSKKSDTKTVDFKVPKEFVEEVKQLVRQGFRVLPKSRHKFVVKCPLCDIRTKSVSKALEHIGSEEHNKWKTNEMPFRGIDRLIATESANNTDIEVVLTRIEVIRELPISTKEEFLSHGIKVKDGFGANGFVDTKCNQLFDSLKECKKHLKEFEELKNSLMNRTTDQTTSDESLKQIERLEQQMSCSNEYIDNLFRSEGIKYRKYDKTVRKQLDSESEDDIPDIYYYCVFCSANFYSKETALYHLNRPIHQKIKRGEYMTPIEAMFAVRSDRIDQLETAFARMEALYRLDNKTKIDLRDKGIRLKDGIGSDAYVCLKCNQSIASTTVDSALFSILRHVNSREHRKCAKN